MNDRKSTPTVAPAFAPLLDTLQTAVALGISKSALAHRRSAGLSSPRFLRIGGSVRYRIQDIEAWVEEQVAEQESAA